jgi:hypothetical protein
MSSLKKISDILIKIAYSDKKDRPSMIKELEFEFDGLPTMEIPKEQQILIASILNELEKESLIGIEINDLDSNKAVKTRTKKTNEVEIVKPVVEEISVVEPETVIVNQEPIIDKGILSKDELLKEIARDKLENRKTKVKPEPKKEEDAFSFLDNIDDAF